MELRAGKVRHRGAQRVPVQQVVHDPAVVDVDRVRPVHVGRLQSGDEVDHREEERVVPHGRVPDEPGDRVLAVRLDRPPEPPADVVERLVPGHLGERPVGLALERADDPVLVVGHTVIVDSLGADVAPGEGVLPVGRDLDDLTGFDVGDDPAERLADLAEGDVLGGFSADRQPVW